VTTAATIVTGWREKCTLLTSRQPQYVYIIRKILKTEHGK